MGWFKDDVAERLNKLEIEVTRIKMEQARKYPASLPADDLPKEGQYIGEVVRMERPQIVANGYRIGFVVDVPGITLFAHVGMIVDNKAIADAMYAVRESYPGKTVKLKARHRAIPNRDPCGGDNQRIIVGWSIESWEGINNEGC